MLIMTACSGAARMRVRHPSHRAGYDDPSLPYGIVAIDCHFHDAHSSIPLDPSRDVTSRTKGASSTTSRSGVRILEGHARGLHDREIRNLGKKLGGPATYMFFCKHHTTLGMVGTIMIK
jgi:hypothetical protein